MVKSQKSASKRNPSTKSIIAKYIHAKLYKEAKREKGHISKSDRKIANEFIKDCYDNWKTERPDKNYRHEPMTAREFAKEWLDTAIDAEDEQRNLYRMWRP